MSEDQIVYIYGLYEEYDQGNIRYVGKAVDLQKRYLEHLADTSNSHKGHWIQACRAVGTRIGIVVLETLTNPSESEWIGKERWWIKTLRSSGCKLVNGTDGGEGVTGYKHTAETLKRLSKLKLGERCHLAKLTETRVLEIRERYAKGSVSQQELANEFGVSRPTLADITKGKTWRHVGGPITVGERFKGVPRNNERRNQLLQDL